MYFDQADIVTISLNDENVDFRDLFYAAPQETSELSVPTNIKLPNIANGRYKRKEAWAYICLANPSFLYPPDLEESGESVINMPLTLPE